MSAHPRKVHTESGIVGVPTWPWAKTDKREWEAKSSPFRIRVVEHLRTCSPYEWSVEIPVLGKGWSMAVAQGQSPDLDESKWRAEVAVCQYLRRVIGDLPYVTKSLLSEAMRG